MSFLKKVLSFLTKTLVCILFYVGIIKLFNYGINRFQLYKNKKGKIVYFSLKRRLSNNFQILIYHSVNNNNDPFFDYSLSVDIFEKQMRYLSQNFCVLKIEDIVEIIKNEKVIPNNLIAVTFDDGYEDNYLYAYPILRKYSIPATIFCTTGFIGTKETLWFNKIRMAFKNTNESCLKLKNGVFYPLTTLEEKLHALNSVMKIVTYLKDKEKTLYINWLINTLKVEDVRNLSMNMLTWEQIKIMSNNSISFGAHTITHSTLTTLSHEQIMEEVIGSKKIIDKFLGTTVKCFTYPNGKKEDFNEDIKKILQEAGYSCALTTIEGVNCIGHNMFELKRIQPWEKSLPLFATKLILGKIISETDEN